MQGIGSQLPDFLPALNRRRIARKNPLQSGFFLACNGGTMKAMITLEGGAAAEAALAIPNGPWLHGCPTDRLQSV